MNENVEPVDQAAASYPAEPHYIIPQLRHLAVPIDSIFQDPENARLHPADNVAVTRGSMIEHGQYLPLIVQLKGRIVRIGNNRHNIARELGWTHVAAIITDRPDEAARALAIVDNRSAELAKWDPNVLRRLIGDMKIGNPSLLKITGFSDLEVKSILKPERKTPTGDPNHIPDPPPTPVTNRGDLWRLGEHRLLCGDSRLEPNVAFVLDGARATCVVTDPPYGVAIGAKNRLLNQFQKSGQNVDDIEDDALSPAELKTRLLPAFLLVRRLAMAEDCTLLMTAPQGGDLGMMMMMMMQEAGLPVRHVLIWMKDAPTFSLGRLDYDYQHEPILMAWGKRHKRTRLGQHQSSVWQIPKPRSSEKHPTMKPVELYVNAYTNHTDPDDVVFEPYAGSGTAFIAAHQLGRRCIGIEKSRAWCDSIVERWEKYSGQKATHVPAAIAVPADPDDEEAPAG